MTSYAVQAKDTELSRYATEIRLRAERRLGELMAERKEAGLLAPPPPPGPGRGKVGSQTDPSFSGPPTLADQGIDKHLADRARKAAAMPHRAMASGTTARCGNCWGGRECDRPDAHFPPLPGSYVVANASGRLDELGLTH